VYGIYCSDGQGYRKLVCEEERSGSNLKFAIQSLAGIILLPLIAWLVTSHGWRIANILAGAVFLLICVPLVWFYVKPQRPEYYGLLPDGESTETKNELKAGQYSVNIAKGDLPEFTLKQATRTVTYWIFAALICLNALIMPMMRLHLIPFLTDRGISMVQAASMAGFMNIISIPVRLVVGFIIDRVKTMNLRIIFILGLIIQLAGVGIFWIFQNSFSIYFWLVGYGVGSGMTQGAYLPSLARVFGRKSYGAILGLVSTMEMFFAFLGPIYIGWIYDSTGSYLNFIAIMTILTAVSAATAFFLIPPKSLPETAKTY
jgi:cyanate permease